MLIASVPLTAPAMRGSPEPVLSQKSQKMNNLNDVVKMSEALPLALLELRAKIATAKDLHPERLVALYPRYCSVMKQIREEQYLSIEELSALSGLSENFLEAAELGTVELTADNLKALQSVYWELAIIGVSSTG
jgi:hypothetical protein